MRNACEPHANRMTYMCAHVFMCAYVDVCMYTRTKCNNTQFSLCMLRWSKQSIIERYINICIHTIQLMHAAIVQEIDQRAQTYAIQQMHATIIQTIGHRAPHKHMQFNPCMQQSSKQLIKELRNTVKNMQMYACIHARSMNICNSTYACFNGPSNRS